MLSQGQSELHSEDRPNLEQRNPISNNREHPISFPPPSPCFQVLKEVLSHRGEEVEVT